MFRKVIFHHLSQGFWLLIFSVLLVNLLPTSSSSSPSSVTELAHSGGDSHPGDCSSATLEIEDSPDVLPTTITEMTFLSPVGLPVQHSPGWLHSWARGSYFAYLTRPPPSLI